MKSSILFDILVVESSISSELRAKMVRTYFDGTISDKSEKELLELAIKADIVTEYLRARIFEYLKSNIDSVDMIQTLELRRVAIEVMVNHGKIYAIKEVRAKTGWGLKEAKDYCDRVHAEEGITPKGMGPNTGPK